jgi:hypothetical protein
LELGLIPTGLALRSPVKAIKARSLTPNRNGQDSPDRPVQCTDPFRIQTGRVRLRMDTRSMQRLVDVDIPKAGKETLIE